MAVTSFLLTLLSRFMPTDREAEELSQDSRVTDWVTINGRTIHCNDGGKYASKES